MVSFHCKSWLLAAAAMALTSGSAQANQVAWMDWTECDFTDEVMVGETCYGTLTTATKTINVTCNIPSGDKGFFQYGKYNDNDYFASHYKPWEPLKENQGKERNPATSAFTSELVDNMPPAREMLGLIAQDKITLTFSEQVHDIFLAFVSLKDGNTFTFDEDFDVLSYGDPEDDGNTCGYYGCGTFSKQVHEGPRSYELLPNGDLSGTLRFPGAHSDLSLTTKKRVTKQWTGITIGILTSEEEYNAEQSTAGSANAQIALPSGNGDPHFKTWKNEHFEFHGQCDVVFTRVKNFAKRSGIDLDIHIRTKMVRYWSYIKSAAIRIGNDVLEVEGSVAKEDGLEKRHYWLNFEYRGPLTEIGGYPVTISPRNNLYTINLGKDFPGQKIEIKTFKEFVSVKIVGGSFESFGTSVGIIGDFKTGKTLGRDGKTVLNDFNDLGLEWQVLPADGKMFHEMTSPQFPELCLLPEDPRGDRARRLAESEITMEEAEAACASLKDPLDKKDCVYDILATQDLDMVGAF